MPVSAITTVAEVYTVFVPGSEFKVWKYETIVCSWNARGLGEHGGGEHGIVDVYLCSHLYMLYLNINCVMSFVLYIYRPPAATHTTKQHHPNL